MNFFNVLEGGVCTMCAPGDQRKSTENQGQECWTEGALRWWKLIFEVKMIGFDASIFAECLVCGMRRNTPRRGPLTLNQRLCPNPFTQ